KYTNAVQGDLLGFTRLEFIPVSVILTFMVVGVFEEVIKLFAVKATDKHQIQSVDDAMEMAFTAALGFAFAENILYFYNIMAFRGVEGILYPFIFRSMFSTFAHIMFSGVLGYYYGLALFATDIMKDEHNKKKFAFTRALARLFHMKKSTLFHEEKMIEGVLLAVVLHAVFNIFLEMEWTFLIVPYLTAGFLLLTYLLNKKESHKVYAYVDDNRNDHIQMQQLSSTLPLDQSEKA
ncbi:PrsW family intramembrane metalloprotease, partial [Candidatus Peregrinibacteria bacterium]|nr:PrsW family intramembrane metalloprotease [Candidatus Peregrinibacteria bacterium]